MRFDRVITNPPFSQNYSRDGMKFTERFRYGFCPETGKKRRPHVFTAHAVSPENKRHDGNGHAPMGSCFEAVLKKRSAKGLSKMIC